MITRIVEEVMVESLEDGLMEAKMMIKRQRMRLVVAVKTRGEIIPIIIKEIKEEEEEVKEIEEEVSMVNVSTTMKKDINHLNILNAKEGMIEEMNGRPKLHTLMKMPNHHNLKILKEDKYYLIEESC